VETPAMEKIKNATCFAGGIFVIKYRHAEFVSAPHM
jgi:hypothetical protein